MPQALQFLILTAAVSLNRQQEDASEYLREENQVLREQLWSEANQIHRRPKAQTRRRVAKLIP